MNNLFIYVIPYNGTPSQSLVSNIRKAYKIESISGKASKTIFCINKSAVGHQNEVFDRDYKREYVKKIKNRIESSDYDEEDSTIKEVLNRFKKDKDGKHLVEEAYKEIQAMNREFKEYALGAISKKNFLFPDWINPDSRRGIKGPVEVREKIDEYLYTCWGLSVTKSKH